MKNGKCKRGILLFAFFFFTFSFVTAQGVSPEGEAAQEKSSNGAWKEFPWALGAGYEYGLYTRENFASGYGISMDRYLLPPLLALGIRGTMYSDGRTVTANEALLTFRAYLPLIDKRFLSASIFTQLGFGASFFSEEGREKNTYVLDALAGCRIYFNRTILRGFYVEPFVRVGFPLKFSGGLAAGHWFTF